MVRKVYMALLYWLPAVCLFSQRDTGYLSLKRLGQEDLTDSIELVAAGEIDLQSRFLSSSAPQPGFSYIITEEEIRQQGYATLGEALKMAPGIRVSQPGSALEGETFLMRGLTGNRYARILINGLPVKPFIAGGMPIGAQLPVKEAERIEVIYGPGNALYGADYLSGVVNIITRTSEKPVYMKADLTIGGGLYSGVNVLFGGKIGRGKHILRFHAYGSNTLFDDRFIFYDRDMLYNPAAYSHTLGGDSTYQDLPNYEGSLSAPLLSNTPHVSRLFGIRAHYRGIAFSIESLYRRDHSALGYSPLVRSYSNPLTYTGEGILKGNIHFEKHKPKASRQTDFTYLLYRTDPRSSYLPIRPYLQGELYRGIAAYAANQTQDPDSVAYLIGLYDSIYNRQAISGGLRYFFAESHEVHFDHLRHYRLGGHWYLSAGGGVRLGFWVPFTDYLDQPVKSDFITLFTEGMDTTGPLRTASGSVFFEANLLSRVLYQRGNWHFSGGFYLQAHSYGAGPSLSPRCSAMYRIAAGWHAFIQAARLMKLPSPYFENAGWNTDSDHLWPVENRVTFRPMEKADHWEAGLHWTQSDQYRGSVAFFVSRYRELLTYGTDVLVDEVDAYRAALGYFQTAGTRWLTGGQAFFQWKNFFPRNLLEGSMSMQWATARQSTPDTLLTYMLELPRAIAQLRLVFHPDRQVAIVFDQILQSRFITGWSAYQAQGFYTLDLQARYAFNERFEVYAKLFNLFNQPYAGISASGSPDDLFYNPQPLFNARLGMVYVLE